MLIALYASFKMSKDLVASLHKVKFRGLFDVIPAGLNLLRFWLRHPIAKRDFLGTVGRFIRWQIGVRVLRMPVVIPWIGGTKLAVEKGMNAATMNYYCKLFEAVDMTLLLHVLRPGDMFLDIGANVGTFTVLASGVAHAATIALEPIPDTYERLMRNLRLKSLRKTSQTAAIFPPES